MTPFEKLGIGASVHDGSWTVHVKGEHLSAVEAREASRRLYALALDISEAEGTVSARAHYDGAHVAAFTRPSSPAVELLGEVYRLFAAGKPLGGTEARETMKRVREFFAEQPAGVSK